MNVAPAGERVERNGKPVPDQAWLSDGDRLALDTLELVFHESVPRSLVNHIQPAKIMR